MKTWRVINVESSHARDGVNPNWRVEVGRFDVRQFIRLDSQDTIQVIVDLPELIVRIWRSMSGQHVLQIFFVRDE